MYEAGTSIGSPATGKAAAGRNPEHCTNFEEASYREDQRSQHAFETFKVDSAASQRREGHSYLCKFNLNMFVPSLCLSQEHSQSAKPSRILCKKSQPCCSLSPAAKSNEASSEHKHEDSLWQPFNFGMQQDISTSGAKQPRDKTEVVTVPTCCASMHRSHSLCVIGGYAFCNVCGAWTTRGLSKRLQRACGPQSKKTADCLSRFRRGKLPYGVQTWPDGRGDYQTTRTVHMLAHSHGAGWHWSDCSDNVAAQVKDVTNGNEHQQTSGRLFCFGGGGLGC